MVWINQNLCYCITNHFVLIRSFKASLLSCNYYFASKYQMWSLVPRPSSLSAVYFLAFWVVTLSAYSMIQNVFLSSIGIGAGTSFPPCGTSAISWFHSALHWPFFIISIIQACWVDFKAIYSWGIFLRRFNGHHILTKAKQKDKIKNSLFSHKQATPHFTLTYRVSHQVEMGKCCPEIGSINVCLSSTLGKEKAMASGTKYVHGVIPRQIGKSNWQNGLPLTEHMRTSAKRRWSIFFIHGMHAAVC